MEPNPRMEGFKKEYLSLVEKYDVDIMSFPQFKQNEGGGFEVVCITQLVDRKSVPSPLSKEDIIKKP